MALSRRLRYCLGLVDSSSFIAKPPAREMKIHVGIILILHCGEHHIRTSFSPIDIGIRNGMNELSVDPVESISVNLETKLMSTQNDVERALQRLDNKRSASPASQTAENGAKRRRVAN